MSVDTSKKKSHTQRARIASLSRRHSPDDLLVVEAHAEMRTAQLEEYIEATVAKAPPLSDEQVARVRAALGRAVDLQRAGS